MQKICDTFCGPAFNKEYYDLAVLALRLVVGFAFVYHGWMKVGNMEGAVTMFSAMGIGAALTYVAAYVEFLGGLALMFGALTKLASGLLAIFMIAAIYLVHLSKGYNTMAGGYEYQLLLLVAVIFFGLVGPGKYAAHEYICKK